MSTRTSRKRNQLARRSWKTCTRPSTGNASTVSGTLTVTSGSSPRTRVTSVQVNGERRQQAAAEVGRSRNCRQPLGAAGHVPRRPSQVGSDGTGPLEPRTSRRGGGPGDSGEPEGPQPGENGVVEADEGQFARYPHAQRRSCG